MGFNFTERISNLITKRAWLILSVAVILTIITGIAARDLQLKSSFVDLLPKDFKSVKSLNEFQSEFGSSTYLTVLIEHDNRDAAIKFMKEFSAEIEKLPEVLYVDYEKPSSFFDDKLLLYLDVDDLKEIDRRVVKYLKDEKKGEAFSGAG